EYLYFRSVIIVIKRSTIKNYKINNRINTTTYNDERKAQNDAHQQPVQRVTLDEQYDGAATSNDFAMGAGIGIGFMYVSYYLCRF
ncbi:hypothetical protein, partial [Enterobacter cloacae complex sp. I2]|uniref:hypothetical protein n=1 Tax=Enterobacter cloacae complex sp. I2 TaxID=2779603 RepID=UPI0018674904